MARPKAYDPGQALDRAVDSFWEQGFGALSVQELCRAMGLNPGSLYGAYGDKRTLFLATLDRYIDTVSREAIERIHQNPSGLAGIAAYLGAFIDAILDGKRRWGCLVTNSAVELALHDPEIAAKVGGHFARLETAFAGALVRAREAGEVGGGGPDLAPYLVCVVQGLNVLAKLKPSRARLELIVEASLAALVLGRDPGSPPAARQPDAKAPRSPRQGAGGIGRRR